MQQVTENTSIKVTYYWLISSNAGLWRLTNRRYETEAQVRAAMPIPPNAMVVPAEPTELSFRNFVPAFSDDVESDRQIRHSGGCQGELL